MTKVANHRYLAQLLLLVIHIIALTVVVHICIAGMLSATDNPEPEGDRSIEIAGKYLGVGILSDTIQNKLSPTAEYVIGQDSTSPFLSDKINGKRVLRVLYKDLRLDLIDHGFAVSITTHGYDTEILLDSATGQLLKITLVRDDMDTAMIREVRADCAERQVGAPWRILPSGVPPVSLLKVLGHARGVPWLKATKVVVYCWDVGTNRPDDDPSIDWSIAAPKGEPDIRWIVYMYGSTTFSALLEKAPTQTDAEIAHFMCEISAVTGEGLICSNSPQAICDEED